MSQKLRLSRRGFLQATAAASAGSALLAQEAVSAASFTRFPNIQNLSATGGSIVWTMPVSGNGTLLITDPSGNVTTWWATVAEFDPSLTGLPATYYQYIATFSGLQADTTYTYQIQWNGQIVVNTLPRPLQFATPGNKAFNFLQFADSGEGNAEQLALRLQMITESVSMVIANGDLAYDLATFPSIEANFYSVYQELMAQVPFFTSLGNHEYMTTNATPSLSSRVTPTAGVPAADLGRYYSFEWGNVHFVALDSNTPLDDAIAGTGQMLNWLDNDLAATRKFWKIVFFHHPGYATGVHQDEPPAGEVRQGIVPILEKHGVQLVFNGHEHTYQRTFELIEGQVVTPNSGGIVYVTSGGGGAEAYYTAPNNQIAVSIGMNNYVHTEVDAASVTLKVRGLGQRSTIDSTVLKPQPQLISAVNSASFNSNLASGGALSILGRNLSPIPVQAGFVSPLFHEQNCTVTLNGTPIPILYADAAQINVQIPFSFSGPGQLMVLTANGTSEASISVAKVSPQFFTGGNGFVNAKHADGSAVTGTSPARPFETITLFATGLGEGNRAVQAGIIPPAGIPVNATVQVSIAGVAAAINPPVLSTSYPGTYEIQVQVPGGLNGVVAVQATANGVVSNTPYLPVSLS